MALQEIGFHNDPSFDELKDIVAAIATKYGVQRVWLFGSRARGDFDSDSDYDFCVVLSPHTKLSTLGGFVQDLEEALGRRVDIASEKGMSEKFRSRIADDMRLVYG